MTPELTIDARWLKTGIGRYTNSLLSGLREHLPDVRLACIAQKQDLPAVSPFVDRVTVCNARIYGVREQLAVPRLAGKTSALYAPHYNVPVFWQGRLLVTIHDLNHLVDPGYRNTWRSHLYARPMLRRAISQAEIIVVPSRYTADRLDEVFSVEPSRVRVIPGCVAPCFQPRKKEAARARVLQNPGISRPFLLFVGSSAPNKNLKLLLTALCRLHQRRADIPLLVIAGRCGRHPSELQKLLHTLQRKNTLIWLDKLPDTTLANLYAAALMTVVPSLEEGFGLPVIESMACGTPVLCSRAASLPEVGGDAALYFSPYASEELERAIETVLDSTTLQQHLAGAGLARAAGFSAQDFSRRQAAAIRAVLGMADGISQSSPPSTLEIKSCLRNA
jgi:glycosyltransferase involved in cell wall biosynthesis